MANQTQFVELPSIDDMQVFSGDAVFGQASVADVGFGTSEQNTQKTGGVKITKLEGELHTNFGRIGGDVNYWEIGEGFIRAISTGDTTTAVDVYIAGGTFNTATWTATNGFIIGLDTSDSNREKIFIGNATSSLDWNVTTADTLTVVGDIIADGGTIGGFEIGTDYIRDVANSFGLASTVTGGDDVRFWAGDTFANRATAPFRVTEAGLITAESGVVGGFTITATALTGSILQTDAGATTGVKITTAGIRSYDSAGNLTVQLDSSGADIGQLFGTLNEFGDGTDGDVVIGGNTTLTRDMFYDDLTIDAGFTLTPAGFRVFVRGVLTVNGTIEYSGNSGGNGANGTNAADPATPGSGGGNGAVGAALSSGSMYGASVGASGGSGRDGVADPSNGLTGVGGSTGATIVKSLGSAGVSGGTGGAGGDTTVPGAQSGGATGAAGGGGTQSGTVFNEIRSPTSAYYLLDGLPAPDILRGPTAGGGGGGGSSGAARADNNAASGGGGGGGGSGSPAGIVAVFARVLIVSATGIIRANGGNGGNGGNAGTGAVTVPGTNDNAAGGSGGGGGGAGGNGGIVILVYSQLTNSGTLAVAGGTAGSGGTATSAVTEGAGAATNGVDGAAGTAGSAGEIIQIQV